MTFIKSPLNYTGGKYKLLPQIIPLFPKNIDTFWDMFGGGFNVGINVTANEVVYVDTNREITNMLYWFSHKPFERGLSDIDDLIVKYKLDKENEEGYLKLRDSYNRSIKSQQINPYQSSIMLYVLICHSFNNQIRFNQKDEFNMPFGRRNFNVKMRENLIKFMNEMYRCNIKFLNSDYKEVYKYNSFGISDFVYCDPPYLGSCATYNERGGWNEEKEIELYQFLDELNSRGVKFALSNNLKDNPFLEEWVESRKYNLYYLDRDYSNCSYNKKNREEDCEVLITNY